MKNNALIRYFVDCWDELKKVTWPTKTQAVKLATIVLVSVFGSALLLALFDFLFSQGYQFLVQLSQKT